MFCVGDYVVHPMHGAGIISDIVYERVNGIRQEYYVFRMPVGGLLLKVPVAKSCAIGLRPIMDFHEAETLLHAIPSLPADSSANWNRRYRENLERIKSGSSYEVAKVIKSLMCRERERGLSTGERKMLHSAKQILISEIVLAIGCAYGEAEAQVNQAMNAKESVK